MHTSVSTVMRSLTATAVFVAGFATAAPVPRTDFEVTGPYQVVMEEEPTLPNHTVYRPADLKQAKGKLPVVVWGNGACSNAGNAFERYLSEIASHGFLVIANGPIEERAFGRPARPGEPRPARPEGGPRPPGGMSLTNSSAAQMLDAITWAQEQSDSVKSYRKRIDRAHIAVAGQSCGGLQALIAAADPRVNTAVIVNSGVIRNLPDIQNLTLEQRRQMPPQPDITKVHTPIIYIIGGPNDIAYANANADFDDLKNVAVFRADLNVGHNGTLWEPHGGKFAEVATAWLAWRLKGDKKAARQFTGPDCGLCRDSSWTVRTRNMETAGKPPRQ
jgi:dienelactone hydrolase